MPEIETAGLFVFVVGPAMMGSGGPTTELELVPNKKSVHKPNKMNPTNIAEIFSQVATSRRSSFFTRCFISLQLSIFLRDFSYADFAEFDFAGEMVHLQ